MVYNIILGRDESDKLKFGEKGLIYLGKGYVKMGNYTSLSNKIWLDVARNHVILITGKRGSGKSYTLGVIAEEISNLPPEISKNMSSLIFDTMGIFWTMKFKNEKERDLLDSWELEAKQLPIKVFIPFGKVDEYKKKGVPIDQTFELDASELEAEDWISIFNLELTSNTGIFIQNVVSSLKKTKERFSLNDVIEQIKKERIKEEIKEIALSLFNTAKSWGVFSLKEKGIEISELLTPSTTNVLDISVYSSISNFNIRALIISIISKKIFRDRMDARKKEEIQAIRRGQEYLSYEIKKEIPLVWIFIDEIHEFMGKEKTPATEALMQILREGRQPGISLVMATQQPGRLHSDVMTQSDIILSHRLTAKADIEALNLIMHSYLLEGIKKQMDDLPRLKGSAIILDDNSERIYPIKVRPRFTWHGGESPSSIKAEK